MRGFFGVRPPATPLEKQLAAIEKQQAVILHSIAGMFGLQSQILQELKNMANAFDTAVENLTATVQQTTDLEASAITLINGIAGQMKQNANDPTKINALADKLKSVNEALANAVTANTPAGAPAGDATSSTSSPASSGATSDPAAGATTGAATAT
jgi:hypothetical protein